MCDHIPMLSQMVNSFTCVERCHSGLTVFSLYPIAASALHLNVQLNTVDSKQHHTVRLLCFPVLENIGNRSAQRRHLHVVSRKHQDPVSLTYGIPFIWQL